MKRMGRRHRPFFRINAIDEQVKRDGKVIEQLGWYNPLERDETKQVKLDEDRVKHWLSQGAQPSDTVMDILAKRNLVNAEAWKAKRAKRVTAKLANLKAAADTAAATAAAATAKAAAAPAAPAAS